MKTEEKRVKPLKRPVQERAKFTVEAIYGAFVRIWRRDGWQQLNTRAVALEAGVSTGTLYEYFPNKEALLSGYVRYCIEALIDAIERQVIQAADLPWRERIERLVRLTCGIESAALPYFDGAMFEREHEIAEPKHHRRAYEELSGKWRRAFASCSGLPRALTQQQIDALFIAVWGGRRYLLMLDETMIEQWARAMERHCIAAASAEP
jgi:AcrR family transcriptional regulator